MRWITGLYIVALIGVLLVSAALRDPQPILMQQNGLMALPLDYRMTFVHYATVQRSDGFTRDLYIDAAVLAALERSESLPQGTRLIIEAYPPVLDADGQPVRDADGNWLRGELDTRIHMAEKRNNWRLDQMPVSSHVGEWNFGSFDASTGAPTDENLNDCFICHDESASPSRDFIFTRRDIDAFQRDGVRIAFTCNLPDRMPCRR